MPPPPEPPGSTEVVPPRDAWLGLSRFTPARIALGRVGGSLPTAPLLRFRVAHARARDAVHSTFSPGAMGAALAKAGIESVVLSTGCRDRSSYLLRPDWGRQLSPQSREQLAGHVSNWGIRQLAIIVSDGLAAQAVERHALATLLPLWHELHSNGWSLYPVFIVPLGRVKLQDEMGELLGAKQTLMLLGERPGLSAPDSLGAYFTFSPRQSCTDANRNCLSNIRTEGTPPALAARKLAHLLTESARLAYSGVDLKDTFAPSIASASAPVGLT